jgi:hypothetical protein
MKRERERETVSVTKDGRFFRFFAVLFLSLADRRVEREERERDV